MKTCRIKMIFRLNKIVIYEKALDLIITLSEIEVNSKKKLKGFENYILISKRISRYQG